MCTIQPVEAVIYDSGKMDYGLMKYGLPDPNDVERWDEEGKGKSVKMLQDALTVPDILNTCKFMMDAGITLEHLADLFSAVTGWELSGQDLMAVGEKVLNLQRMFNMREGLGRKDDRLPERITNLPDFGYYENELLCKIENFDAMLHDYYEARKWNPKTGVPSKEKLEQLELDNHIQPTNIKVHLYTVLKKFGEGKIHDNNMIRIPKPLSLQELAIYLDIPDNPGTIFLVNNKPHPKKYIVKDGDIVRICGVVSGG